jgi:general secretion pathway protein I
LSRKNCSDGAAGFTLIEVLVALAIVTTVLSSIGMVISTTVKGTRSIDQRLDLAGTAETLLASLPARNLLRPGHQSGQLAGHRWWIDVAPMNASVRDDPQAESWIPLVVTLQVQAANGRAMQVTTVRLVPKGVE